MPQPDIVRADQVVLVKKDGQEAQPAKRLVKVVKPYKTEPDFYQLALNAARVKKEAEAKGNSKG